MKTELDWSHYENEGMGDAYADIPKNGGDYAKAISVCINSMTCLRPIDRGVMCPSFRISNNAAFSPGGRVRLLKKALQADTADALFEDPELVEAMDLCVGCKGCSRECENYLDMAMIKVEYMAQMLNKFGGNLRQTLFAYMPQLLRSHRLMRSLIILRNRSTLARRLGALFVGISPDRDLPVPAPQRFTAPQSDNNVSIGSEDTTQGEVQTDKELVLLIDTFTDHYEPNSADAALAVLKAAGYQVHIPINGQMRSFCCGRTWFSSGYISKAKTEAEQLLIQLRPWIERGVPIVGLEPSCILMLRDEFKTLKLGEVAAQAAANALLFEEFLAKEHAAGRLNLALQPYQYNDTLLIHGHCHEKAVGAMKSMRKVVKLIPDANFEFIEASCCGGAGSFAYEQEHHIASLQMGELALFPKLREHQNAPVISNGFSCREQMRYGVNRQTKHLAEVLMEHLADAPVPTS